MIITLPIFFPVLAGLAMIKLQISDRKARERYVFITLLSTLVFTLIAGFADNGGEFTVASFARGVDVAFKIDSVAVFFSTIFAAIWLLVGVFSMEYLKHEGEDNRFFTFYISSLGALIGVAYAANLATLYICFEAMSLLSYVLVVHSRTARAFSAGRKYIY